MKVETIADAILVTATLKHAIAIAIVNQLIYIK